MSLLKGIFPLGGNVLQFKTNCTLLRVRPMLHPFFKRQVFDFSINLCLFQGALQGCKASLFYL